MVKAGKPVPCYGRIHTVDIGDFPVSLFIYIGKKISHSFHIVGHNRYSIVENMVYGYYRYFTSDKLFHFWIVEVHTYNCNSIKASVSAMLQIRHPAIPAPADIDKGDIISLSLCCALKAVKHKSEIVVCQSAVIIIRKQNSNIICTVCFQCLGC